MRHRLSMVSADGDDVYDSGDIPSNIVNGYGYHDHIVPPDAIGGTRVAKYAAFEFDARSRVEAPKNVVDWAHGVYTGCAF